MRRHLSASLAAAIFAVLTLTMMHAQPATHAAPAPVPAKQLRISSGATLPWCTQWRIVSAPQPSGAAVLTGVATVSANNVWAVGSINAYPAQATLIEHFDGSAWSIVSSPNATTNDVLQSVVALAANDVWAVGTAFDSSGNAGALFEHYDGSAWNVVSGPAFDFSVWLTGIAADTTNDIWAVGYFQDSGGDLELVAEHYDGTSWSFINPISSASSWFSSVSVVSGQVFAAGIVQGPSSGQTLVEHYVSGSWSVMGTPNAATGDSYFKGIAALSLTNVWAVGIGGPTNLIEHWNGSSWSIVAPGSSPTQTWSNGIAAVPTTTNLWAVGGSAAHTPYTQQWLGTMWKTATVSAPAGTSSSELYAVTSASSMDAWAVGASVNSTSGIKQPLIEHYSLALGVTCPYP